MNVEIAERLAKRRREAGYSQENLAEQLGVSRQAVSKWERSESSPDTDNLIALAQLYGVSLDELLYVDESIKDDVAFEASDRASATSESQQKENPEPEAKSTDESPEAETDSSEDSDEEKKTKVNIGLGGIHVKDGDDYVHVSWRDGVHVKDTKEGEEVHVGWSGVHVKEGKQCSTEDAPSNEAEWKDAKVIINGEEYDSWKDAHKDLGHGYKHSKNNWMKFPFPLLVIIAYILVGVFTGQWVLALLLAFIIPVYYLLGHAISDRRPSLFFAGGVSNCSCCLVFVHGFRTQSATSRLGSFSNHSCC